MQDKTQESWDRFLYEFNPDNKKDKNLPKEDARVKDKLYIISAVRDMIIKNKTANDITDFLKRKAINYKEYMSDIIKLAKDKGLIGKVYVDPTYFDCKKSGLKDIKEYLEDKCKVLYARKCSQCIKAKKVAGRVFCADADKEITDQITPNSKLLKAHLDYIKAKNSKVQIDDLTEGSDSIYNLIRKGYSRLANNRFEQNKNKDAQKIIDKHAEIYEQYNAQEYKESIKIQKQAKKMEQKIYNIVVKSIKKAIPIRDIGMPIRSRDRNSIVKKALEEVGDVSVKCFDGCEDKLLKNSNIIFNIDGGKTCLRCRNNSGNGCILNGRPFSKPYSPEQPDCVLQDMGGVKIKVPRDIFELNNVVNDTFNQEPDMVAQIIDSIEKPEEFKSADIDMDEYTEYSGFFGETK